MRNGMYHVYTGFMAHGNTLVISHRTLIAFLNLIHTTNHTKPRCCLLFYPCSLDHRKWDFRAVVAVLQFCSCYLARSVQNVRKVWDVAQRKGCPLGTSTYIIAIPSVHSLLGVACVTYTKHLKRQRSTQCLLHIDRSLMLGFCTVRRTTYLLFSIFPIDLQRIYCIEL